MTSVRAIVLAPNAFKGSASAPDVAAAMARGCQRALGDSFLLRLVPIADGGDGTTALFLAHGARRISARSVDALGRPVDGVIAMRGTTGIVDTASASGLARLTPAERDAARASSAGTGLLVRAALDAGAHEIVLGIGGTASTDGGAGMLTALGIRFLDADGRPLGAGGGALTALARIDRTGLDERLPALRSLTLACDVTAPLLGPAGAAAVFAPQKGADAAEVVRLERGLARFAEVVRNETGVAGDTIAGAGAGGGTAFGALALLGARLRPGFDLLAELTGLPQALRGAALCVTGEGAVDRGSLRGKGVGGVAVLARSLGVPVAVVAGRIDPAIAPELTLAGIVATRALDTEGATGIDDPLPKIESATEVIVRATLRK